MQKERILVVVDPTAADQPAAARGLQLAAALDCDLELLICHHDRRINARRLFAADEREALREQSLRHQLGYLKSLRDELGADDVQVITRVVWDSPLAEGIVRATLRDEPRLVLKDTHHHTAIERTLFTSTDWHLIRDCPAPLWLVKPVSMHRPLILAAVDPTHEHEKPAALDETVLALAAAMANALDGELHVYHGYDALSDITSAGALAMSPTPIAVEEISARLKAEHAAAFAELMGAHDVAKDHQHLVAGNPSVVLPDLARQLGAGLLVMGAVARGRLQQAVIGSTAERVLDHLPCDVLIVKPPGFDSSVTYKAQAPDFMELRGSDE
ncbi:MAG: universal stress protein [Chromatiales bacterium]|nr:MAG: universal stress protein [Chromatiales bacterium]